LELPARSFIAAIEYPRELNPAPHSSRARREQYDETMTMRLQRQSQIETGDEIRAPGSIERRQTTLGDQGVYGSPAAHSP
jgi:hypothetical protein